MNSYDALGRTVSVVSPDGSSTKTYAYAGNTATVTDEAGKWKKYSMDAMGNLLQVTEPDPANPTTATYVTNYGYDVLSHLTSVNMPRPTGTQTRTFNYGTPPGAYLLSATNPESGTVSYTYNSNGLLLSKMDAKNQQTQYGYDSYTRLTQIRHYPVSGGSEDVAAQVNMSYDTNPYDGSYSQYALGRMAARQYTNNGTTFTDMYSYTRPGQVARKKLRVTRYGVDGDLEGLWSYDNEGRMVSVTYPNGQAYAYSYDTMGRPNAMTDQGTQQPVISSVSYGPAGELLSITGVVNETRSYNSRLQLTALNNVSYVYPAANNGKIQSQTDSVSGEQITYAYDALNRLISGVTSDNPNVTQWGQGFTYDGFGNLTGKSVTNGTAPYLSVGVDAATNRIVGYQYDANGNQTWSNTQTLGYDYDNRMVNADNRNYTGSQYGYDPDNKRVYTADWTYDYNTSLTTVSNEVVYFFGVTGQRMAAYTLVAYASPPTVTLTRANDRVYFGGELIRGDSGQWADPDRLGSVGTYFPYGEARGGGGGMFATYSRDGSGLDYADQRYYWSNLGRFTTADPYRPSAGPANPASWNRYTYSGGDPINTFDPSGLEGIPVIKCSFNGLVYYGTFCEVYARYFQPSGQPRPNPDFDTNPALLAAYRRDQAQNELTTTLQNKTHDAVHGLSALCQSELEKKLSVSLLDDQASSLNFYNADLPYYRALRVNKVIANSTSFVTLGDVLGKDIAAVLPDDNGNLASTVLLGNRFFAEVGVEQAGSLLHELLHVFLNRGDTSLAGFLGLGAFADTREGNDAASLAITSYIEGCLKP